MDRYGRDVLAAPRQTAPQAPEVEARVGDVLEEPGGYVGAIVRWENGLVVLEDRHGRRRSFPRDTKFLVDGRPIRLVFPQPSRPTATTYTASGSLAARQSQAHVALPSRIYVEGRHDAELVEKIWGDDLRHVGVVVEMLDGVDNLVDITRRFDPGPGRRMGVLVDHLVAGSKESRVADEIARLGFGDFVLVTGHQFVDIWQAVLPERVGLSRWPDTAKDSNIKVESCRALGLPYASQADLAAAWRAILGQVTSWRDVDLQLVQRVEMLIDFVTQDHLEH